MRQIIKYKLSRFRVWSIMSLIRSVPQIYGWIMGGCTSYAPAIVKRYIISAYLKRFKVNQFIETGTYLGDTLAHLALDKSVMCTSIELSDKYYKEAYNRFKSWSNVTLLHGDSGEKLPELVKKIEKPALFWLDGHYSGAQTAQGEMDTPISQELKAILDSPVKTHIILIDDARCFDGTHGYPFLDELLVFIRGNSNYNIEVSSDIIRLTPDVSA